MVKAYLQRKAPRGKEERHERLEKSSTCKMGMQIVILPKYRRKVLYGRIKQGVGKVIRSLCIEKGLELIEGNAALDHIHIVLSIPPKFSVAMTMGYLKGKSAIRINRDILKQKGSLFGRSFWARGYCVSTVGLDEKEIRRYVREQEKHQVHMNQMELEI